MNEMVQLSWTLFSFILNKPLYITLRARWGTKLACLHISIVYIANLDFIHGPKLLSERV